MFLKRAKKNNITYKMLSTAERKELAEMYEIAYNDYLENHYNTKELVKEFVKLNTEVETNAKELKLKFGKLFMNKHNDSITPEAQAEMKNEIVPPVVDTKATKIPFTGFADELDVEEADDDIAQSVFYGGDRNKGFRRGELPVLGIDGNLVSGTKIEKPTSDNPGGVARRISRRRG